MYKCESEIDRVNIAILLCSFYGMMVDHVDGYKFYILIPSRSALVDNEGYLMEDYNLILHIQNTLNYAIQNKVDIFYKRYNAYHTKELGVILANIYFNIMVKLGGWNINENI